MAGSGQAHLRPEAETLLRVENLVVEFPVGGTGLKVHAVSDVSVDIADGETLGLVGESGCGKTTTGRAMMQVPAPTSGSVKLDSEDLTMFGNEAIRDVRSKMQMIFQDPISSLNPRHTIREIVAEPLVVDWLERLGRSRVSVVWERYVRWLMPLWRKAWSWFRFVLLVGALGVALWTIGESIESSTLSTISAFVWVPASIVGAPFLAFFGVTALAWLALGVAVPVMAIPRLVRARRDKERFWNEAEARVRDVLTTVGLDPDVAMDKRPHEFSGGQAQRICIARALTLDPKVMICDEPVSALDVSVQAQILNLLEDMKETYGLTMVFISHDLAVVKNISDRVAVMYLGKVCEIAPPDELYFNPAHPYSSALISSIPVPDPSIDQREIQAIEGELPSPIAPPSGCRFRTRCAYATELCVTDEPVIREIATDHYVACHHPLVEDSVAPRLSGALLDDVVVGGGDPADSIDAAIDDSSGVHADS
ncbi:MAG: oligopeptide/dipeptide ABC transporter ATP-binding protein [Acidimicrobiales bacterium]